MSHSSQPWLYCRPHRIKQNNQPPRYWKAEIVKRIFRANIMIVSPFFISCIGCMGISKRGYPPITFSSIFSSAPCKPGVGPPSTSASHESLLTTDSQTGVALKALCLEPSCSVASSQHSHSFTVTPACAHSLRLSLHFPICSQLRDTVT